VVVIVVDYSREGKKVTCMNLNKKKIPGGMAKRV
jgi:hypothetical protein